MVTVTFYQEFLSGAAPPNDPPGAPLPPKERGSRKSQPRPHEAPEKSPAKP